MAIRPYTSRDCADLCRLFYKTVHASLTARPFFEARGYEVIRDQRVLRRGVILTNFVMEKRL